MGAEEERGGVGGEEDEGRKEGRSPTGGGDGNEQAYGQRRWVIGWRWIMQEGEDEEEDEEGEWVPASDRAEEDLEEHAPNTNSCTSGKVDP